MFFLPAPRFGTLFVRAALELYLPTPRGGAAREAYMDCDTCLYYEYDEEFDDYYCSMDMDEDDFARIMQDPHNRCPFWRDGDEYKTVRRQM